MFTNVTHTHTHTQEFRQLSVDDDPSQLQQMSPPPLQQLQTNNVAGASGFGGPSPGVTEMNAAYEVSRRTCMPLVGI